MNIAGTRMSMKRGDDDAFVVFLGESNYFEPGDKVYFNLRKREEDTETVLQKLVTTFVEYTDNNDVVHSGVAIINFDHEDTADLFCGQYVYDIHIQWKNGIHQTPVGPYKFILAPGASD